MTFNASTAPIGEKQGYPRERYTPRGIMAERCVVVNWADRYGWTNEFLTNPAYPYLLQAGYTNTPYLIDMHFQPLPTNAVTSSSSSAGYRPDACAIYDKAELYLTYSSINTGFVNNQVIQVKVDQRFAADKVGCENLFWDAGHTSRLAPSETPTLIQPGETYSIIYPFASSSAVNLIPGQCNSGTFVCPLFNRNYANETLLYVGSEIDIAISVTGLMRFRKRVMTQWAPNGWNKHWRPSVQDWVNIYTASGTIYKQHPPVSFNGNL